MTTGDHAMIIIERLLRRDPDEVAAGARDWPGRLIQAAEALEAIQPVLGRLAEDELPDEAAAEAARDWAIAGAVAFFDLACLLANLSDPGATVGPPTRVPNR